MTEYLPPEPLSFLQSTQAFEERELRENIQEVLGMIEYLQDITHRAIVLDGAKGCELLPAEVEIALGCGEEAAIICMQAADYEQSAKNGRWFSKPCKLNPQLITGKLRDDIRQIVASSGLRSHKLRTRTGNKAVFITGVGVVGANLIVPNRFELRSKELWAELISALTLDELDAASTRLLSHLGGVRAVVGPKSRRGQKIASEMNSIRQKRTKAQRIHQAEFLARSENLRSLTEAEKIERKEEIDSIAF